MAASRASRFRLVSVLGFNQMVAWGCAYYFLSVFGPSISTDTGWPPEWVFAGLSVSLCSAAMFARKIGLLTKRHGGRTILICSSILFAAAFFLQSISTSMVMFCFAWFVMGLAMACGLYDTAFATLVQQLGSDARRSISAITLVGGFASSWAWPAGAFLMSITDWRTVSLLYAALNLLVCLPLYVGLPKPGEVRSEHGDVCLETSKDTGSPRSLLLLGTSFVLMMSTTSMLAVHLLTVLSFRDFSLSEAVTLGALVGPAQVGVRLVETFLGGRYDPIWTFALSGILVSFGVGLLTMDSAAFLAIVLYGCGSGLFLISRGTVPLRVFGIGGYVGEMSKMAGPLLLIQAVTPVTGSLIITNGGVIYLLWGLAAASIASIAFALALKRIDDRPAAPGTR